MYDYNRFPGQNDGKTSFVFYLLMIALSFFFFIPPGHTASVENAQPIQPSKGKAILVGKSGSAAQGEFEFVQKEDSIEISGTIKDLEPLSVHALHIHEKGSCEGDKAKQAGGHFNPTNEKHGSPDTEPHHLGDLGNFSADANGVAKVHMFVKDANISEQPTRSFLHRAIIVHQNDDDFRTQPAGDAGPRILCGVINKEGVP